LLWLFGPDYHQMPLAPAARSDIRAAAGGYVTLRTDDGFAFTRAASFRHRPAHADMLHVDLWWRGENVAIDPGTFSYNAPPSWSNALASSLYHNTVTVDGHDQMARAGRFLWLPWLQARQFAYPPGGGCWQGEHDGYQRLRAGVMHWRSIQRLDASHWFVLDRLGSAGPHDYRLHWLLADFPYQWSEHESALRLDTPEGPYCVITGSGPAASDVSLVRADEHSPRGWRARGYQCRQPAVSLARVARGQRVVFWTLLGPAADEIEIDRRDNVIRFAQGGWEVSVMLASAEVSSGKSTAGRTDLEVRPTAT
jgi:asparagine synthase (glutamine-hydrolysing)